MLKPTIIAIPFFALLTAVEAWLAVRENRENFNRQDTWTNVAPAMECDEPILCNNLENNFDNYKNLIKNLL